jgi:hypothetical protein
MNRITIHPPEVDGQTVTVRWGVDPPTPLYRSCQFTLRFPDPVELCRIPDDLWWTTALACLHPHWPLLRPCRIELPVRLPAGEPRCGSG